MDSEQDFSTDGLAEMPADEYLTAGQRLRAAREEQRLDLAHVAAETRIPQRHLETIEDGAFEELPSRTYAIGFSRTYARAVGLDEKEIADAVREELAEGHARQSALAGGMEPGDPAKLPSSGLAWAGAAAAVILAVGVFAFYNTYFASGTGPASLLAEQEAEEAAQVAAAEASDAGTEPAAGTIDANGQVVFTARENLWVRFYDRSYEQTGEPLFEGEMTSGDSFEVPGDAEGPLINTGRPDALAITIDGQDVPMLADEPVTLGDTPISAEALLARAQTSASLGAVESEPQLN
ncbi:helix-turn-helix domain-containing protein [Erythrobacter sp. THAF29]|uniref:helix-turn-helix domain-containing protein n=1 Tax=Erythrobacter sp. THAF29 TaxID=2587851 RepID=UPI0012A78661|nr:helix-turn-helix domain-containing protein [Erythrobacter sp. THAF29]QFT76896.1 cytoskeletal protein RodZ [Erythrobacter sp. THAF29]